MKLMMLLTLCITTFAAARGRDISRDSAVEGKGHTDIGGGIFDHKRFKRRSFSPEGFLGGYQRGGGYFDMAPDNNIPHPVISKLPDYYVPDIVIYDYDVPDSVIFKAPAPTLATERPKIKITTNKLSSGI